MQIEQTIQQIINNSTELYNTGYAQGKTEGTEEGYVNGYAEGETKGYQEGYGIQDEAIAEADKKLAKTLLGTDTGAETWYDAFWDAAQSNGAKQECQIRFWDGWNDKNFRPKYDIYASTYTFTNGLDGSQNISTKITDLRPETIGVNIDWSLCTNFNYILRCSDVKYIGVVDMTNATSGWCLFRGAAKLEYVEKVILPPTLDVGFKNGGFICENLKHISFENYFLSAVKFSECVNLTHDSLVNILNALYDYVNGDLDGSGKDKTLTLGTTNLAKLTNAEKAIATQKGWTLA